MNLGLKLTGHGQGVVVHRAALIAVGGAALVLLGGCVAPGYYGEAYPGGYQPTYTQGYAPQQYYAPGYAAPVYAPNYERGYYAPGYAPNYDRGRPPEPQRYEPARNERPPANYRPPPVAAQQPRPPGPAMQPRPVPGVGAETRRDDSAREGGQ